MIAHHGDRVQQLLQRRLFPATTTDPQTASTFALLESAHVLSVQSKLSLYDLYMSLEILTDATRVSDVKVRTNCLNFLQLPPPLTPLKGSLSSIFTNA